MPTPTAPRTESDLRDGLMLGLIAFVVVAAFYNAFDLIAARGPFHTVNLLGRSVFHGIRDADALTNYRQGADSLLTRHNQLHRKEDGRPFASRVRQSVGMEGDRHAPYL